MSFFLQYVFFLAKLVSAVLAILIVTAGIFTIARKAKEQTKHKLSIKKLNKKYQELANALNAEILTKKEQKKHSKELKIKLKKNEKL
ncbi:MAG: non-proteolytic protein peptidase family, partial [Pseudomonadota bacterium]